MRYFLCLTIWVTDKRNNVIKKVLCNKFPGMTFKEKRRYDSV